MISIIIVNWNAGNLLKNVLESIEHYHDSLVSMVIVVDNNSTDGSVDELDMSKKRPFQLELIRNKKNNGFGAACNQGAALAISKYLLFLNPDTRLFKNSLIEPYLFMQEPINNKVGVVGIQLVDSNNKIACSCSRFPSLTMFFFQIFGINKLWKFPFLSQEMSEWKHDTVRSVDQVIGAFFLIRKELFRSLSGFDTRFFVYFEEVDLSFRAHKLGYNSVYLSTAQAFHMGGGISAKVKDKRLFYTLRSRLQYGFKHFPPFKAWTLVGITLFLEPISRILFSSLLGEFKNVKNIIKAYLMLYVDIFNQLLKKNS